MGCEKQKNIIRDRDSFISAYHGIRCRSAQEEAFKSRGISIQHKFLECQALQTPAIFPIPSVLHDLNT